MAFSFDIIYKIRNNENQKLKKLLFRRKADHEAANEERKLTPAERKEKNARKLKEDTTFGVHVGKILREVQFLVNMFF